MRLSRRKLDVAAHLGLFTLHAGALSVFGFLQRLNPALGSAAFLGFVLLNVALLLYVVWRVKRLPMWGLVAFGLLPYVMFAAYQLSGAPTTGSFAYLYKFAPFVFAPFMWLWMRRANDETVERIFTIIALIVALRALIAFALPGMHVGRAGSGAPSYWDDFLIYERVGPLARVFYPGMSLAFLGLLLSIENVFSARARNVRLEVIKAALFLSALLVTLSRGTIAFAVLLTLVYVIVKLWRTRTARTRMGRFLMAGLLGLSALSLLFAVTPLESTVRGATAQFAGSERFSLDQGNIDWRVQQVDLAFALVNTPEERVLGVGTNVGIPDDIKNLFGPTTNELHYSFHSILWTFGYLGIGLLVLFGFLQPLARTLLNRAQGKLVLAFGFVAVFIALVGSYTIAFTLPDWNFLLITAVAYLHTRATATARHRVRLPSTVSSTTRGAAYD